MSSSKKYGFVILHYMAFEMTVKCVEMLIKMFSDYRIHICIVDNASSNDTGRMLLDKYKNSKIISVLLNKSNDGFAKGNNLGYKYVLDKFNPDYIIVLNNDVIIEQNEFLEQIDEIYKYSNFAVLGPDIFCPYTEKHQSPSHRSAFTEDELLCMRKKYSRYCKYPAFYYYRHKYLGGIKRKIFPPKDVENRYDIEQENVVLHGACYIFSRIFMDKREYCFCTDTFLYMEEEFLKYDCEAMNLKMLYSPRIKVKHLDDISTDFAWGNGLSKARFRNEEILRSIERLQAYLNKKT